METIWIGAIPVIGIIIVGYLALRRRRSSRGEEAITPMTRGLAGGARPGSGRIFFGCFLIVGLGVLIPFGLMFVNLARSSAWVQTDCTIISSDVGVHSGDDGNTYSVDIIYDYEWNGQQYTGDDYNFSMGTSSGYEGKAEVVRDHPPGAVVPCWVNPGNPEQSVLNRRLGWEAVFIILPLAFVGVGLLGLLGILGTFTPRRKTDWLPGSDAEESTTPAGPSVHHRAIAGLPSERADPWVLESKSSPARRLIGSIIFAILWNGFIWGVAWMVVIGEGERNGCVIAFLGVFGLIGLMLIAAVPYNALALANPRVKARLGGDLAPGRSTSISWSFEGKAERIQKLIIRLEGREEATYRSGTDTHTATNVFFDEVMIEVTDRHSLRQGQATIAVPAEAMHSFDGGNNRITWMLSIQGDIPRWPDVREEFVLTVKPEGLAK